MTTGRINQVAILAVTQTAPRAVCSDSARSARPRGKVPPSTRRKGTGKKGRDDYGQRGDDTRVQDGRARAARRQRAGARAPKRPAKKAYRARATARRQRGPPTLGKTAQCETPHGSSTLTHPPHERVDWVGAWGRLLLPVMMSVTPPGRHGTEGHDASNAVHIVLHVTFRDRAGARHGATADAAPPSRTGHGPIEGSAPPRRDIVTSGRPSHPVLI